ncbi:hypothetical protein MRI28_17150 [Nocardiopsis dassonvillei]|uniref:hypothetical protein n=1 Tax=Nocardiopsis dassonvillei TaxID=2014 RepID=UPI00200F2EEC|nr:hypothetical protein [Nocardiopsis dassonvillei]MCK9871343.1 hypothetical protein [Nocardiopsis dassonvillei]
MTPRPRRLFVLLTWNPDLGLPIDPVGVLGLETDGESITAFHVSWIPPLWADTDGWRQRLHGLSVTTAHLEKWLAEDGTLHLAEDLEPPPAPSLALLVEGYLEQVMMRTQSRKAI